MQLTYLVEEVGDESGHLGGLLARADFSEFRHSQLFKAKHRDISQYCVHRHIYT